MGQEKDLVAVTILQEILNKTLDQKLATIHEVRNEVDQFNRKVKEQEYKIEKLENYSRRNNVILHGVPQSETDEEDPIHLIEVVGNAVGVQIFAF